MRRRLVLMLAWGLACLASGNAWGADATATAAQRIDELDGKIRYDADKNVIGVDLLDRAATDADVKRMTCFTDLRELSLWGAEITDAGVEQLAALRSSPTWCWKTLKLPTTGWQC